MSEAGGRGGRVSSGSDRRDVEGRRQGGGELLGRRLRLEVDAEGEGHHGGQPTLG